jgi:hypothetical protein
MNQQNVKGTTSQPPVDRFLWKSRQNSSLNQSIKCIHETIKKESKRMMMYAPKLMATFPIVGIYQ